MLNDTTLSLHDSAAVIRRKAENQARLVEATEAKRVADAEFDRALSWAVASGVSPTAIAKITGMDRSVAYRRLSKIKREGHI